MTAQHPIDGQSRAQRVLSWLVDRPGRVVLGLVAITAVLVVAGISTAPDEDASFSPGGEIFDTGELVERTFRASTSELLFIVEDEGADALDLESLREWKRNSEELRASAELSPAFSTFFDDALGRMVVGFYTLADAVDDELRAGGVSNGLEGATDDDVKIALSRVLDEGQPTVLFRDALSVQTTSEPQAVGGEQITLWSGPAFLATLRVAHSAFPVDLESKSEFATRTDSQQDAIDDERDLEIEHWARDAQSILRGDQEHLRAWGVAIDGGLTGDEAFQSRCRSCSVRSC